MKRIAALILAATIAAVTLFGVSAPANAQTPPTTVNPVGQGDVLFDDPSDRDLFIRMLTFLMPSTGPIPDNREGAGDQALNQAVKDAFMAFSATLLFLGGGVTGWQIVSSMVAAAKEGKTIGQKYHEVWGPMRVVIGFSMLTPLAGGLCAAQIICLYLVVWGGNLANAVWVPYIDAITFNSSESSSTSAERTIGGMSLPIANEAVKNVVERELCHAMIKTYLTRTGDQGAGTQIITSPKWNKELTGAGLWWGPTETLWRYDYGPACGSIEIKVPLPAEGVDAANDPSSIIGKSQQEGVADIISMVHGEAQTVVNTYQNTGGNNPRYFLPTTAANDLLKDLARQAKAGYTAKVVDAAAKAFNLSNTNSNTGLSSIEKFRQEAKENGWASSGVFFLNIGRVQAAVYRQVDNTANFTAYNDLSPGNMPATLSDMMFGTPDSPGVILAFRGWWSDNVDIIVEDFTGEALNAGDGGISISSILTAPFEWASGLWKHVEGTNYMNPMQNMVDFGNHIMYPGMATYSMLSLIGGAADGAKQGNILNAIPGGGNLLSAGQWAAAKGITDIVMLGQLIAIAMMAAGAVHAYVLPMFPYIMVTFFLGGLALLVVESLVAAPLWAFFHVRMDGQEFVSEVQKPGYMIAFNLLLRPSLMVFGLMLSYVVFGAMTWLVHTTFYPAADSLGATAGIGPIGMVVMVVMVTYIHFQLAVRTFSMITKVPDRVSRWFGQGGDHLGEDEDSKSINTFMAGGITNKLEGIAGKKAMTRGVKPQKTPKPPKDGNKEEDTDVGKITQPPA